MHCTPCSRRSTYMWISPKGILVRVWQRSEKWLTFLSQCVCVCVCVVHRMLRNLRKTTGWWGGRNLRIWLAVQTRRNKWTLWRGFNIPGFEEIFKVITWQGNSEMNNSKSGGMIPFAWFLKKMWQLYHRFIHQTLPDRLVAEWHTIEIHLGFVILNFIC